MSLAQLQRDFSAHILTGAAEVEPHIKGGARRGLAVYRHAYRATLTECLRDSFEKTLLWLGEDAFDAAALIHIPGHPPSSWTLADYGRGFDQTLAGLYPDDPEIEELAWLDWSLRRAFDGPDAPPLDPAALAEVDWDAARLSLAPTLVMCPVTTNCAALWTGLVNEEPPAAQTLDGFAGLIVWRQALSPRFVTLTQPEYRALEQAKAGVSFGAICSGLAEEFPDPEAAAAYAGGLLGRWLADGVVIGTV